MDFVQMSPSCVVRWRWYLVMVKAINTYHTWTLWSKHNSPSLSLSATGYNLFKRYPILNNLWQMYVGFRLSFRFSRHLTCCQVEDDGLKRTHDGLDKNT